MANTLAPTGMAAHIAVIDGLYITTQDIAEGNLAGGFDFAGRRRLQPR
jgi:hypothetical protein